MARFSVALHALVLLAQTTSVLSDQFSGSRPLDLAERAVDPLSHCLQSGLSKYATVETIGEGGFLNDSIRYATLESPSFRTVAKVACEKDIAVAIKCATQTNTSFLATSARHGFSTTLTSISNGLEIDTSFLNQVRVDAKRNLLTIGGAVIFEQAIEALYQNGKEIPTGSCYCVGMVGATLGGGIGRLSGLHGLTLDSLLAVRIMLPNTTIVEASRNKNSELFWGIRGSGFNFGVVIYATYRVYDQVPQGRHLNADFIFPISQVKSYYEKLAEAQKSFPAQLSILSFFNFNPVLNQTTITTNAVYAGPEAEGRKAVQFLIDQKPLLQNLTMVPWNRLIQSAAFGATGPPLCVKGRRRGQWGVGVNQIDPETYSKVAVLYQEMITKYPASINSVLDMQLLPTQGVLAVPQSSTSYPWRSLIAHVLLTTEYSDETTNDETTGYPRRIREALIPTAGTDGFEVYVSYSHGDETIEQLYSKENLPRLAALKKKIDPNGLFNAYHPVPTAYP
ncbi:hypothetical protein MMC30_008822 [Trapelia coarctata]|nr:hypothetical protein [Trapelia coarctata]